MGFSALRKPCMVVAELYRHTVDSLDGLARAHEADVE